MNTELVWAGLLSYRIMLKWCSFRKKLFVGRFENLLSASFVPLHSHLPLQDIPRGSLWYPGIRLKPRGHHHSGLLWILIGECLAGSESRFYANETGSIMVGLKVSQPANSFNCWGYDMEYKRQASGTNSSAWHAVNLREVPYWIALVMSTLWEGHYSQETYTCTVLFSRIYKA